MKACLVVYGVCTPPSVCDTECRFDALAVEDIVSRSASQSPNHDKSSDNMEDFMIRDSHVFVSESKRLSKAAAMRLHASQVRLSIV